LAVLQGQHRFDAFNLLRVIPTSSYVVVVLALFLFGRADLVAVTIAYVGTTFLGGVLTLAVATRRLPKSRPDPAGPRIWEMARFGFKSLLATVSPVDALRLDQIAVGLFLNPVALGYYVVAQSLTGLPRLVAISMGMIVYPRIASQPDAAAARRSVWKYFAFGAALCAGIAGALAVAAGVLIRLFFGSEFSSAVLIARLLLLAVVFITARRILTDGANGLGHPGLGTIAEVASWVILLPSLALLLPPYGAEGVAIALVIAWGGSLVIMISLVASIGRKRQ
jgi:O-antigen/teichoic acid export membrane protein